MPSKAFGPVESRIQLNQQTRDSQLSCVTVQVEDGVTALSRLVLDAELSRPLTSRELDCLGTLAMNAEDLIRTIEALRKKCRSGCGHEPGHVKIPQCRR